MVTTRSQSRATAASPSLMERVLRADFELGRREYLATRASTARQALAEVLSLSCDEAFWFGLPAVVGSVLFARRGLSARVAMGCAEELCWDLFGTAAACIILEQTGKLLVRRARPTYHSKNAAQAVWVYPGERHSFPSGHTIRAAYLAHYLAVGFAARAVRLDPRTGPLARSGVGAGAAPPSAAPLLVWAAMIGWSRVAKGRHYPLDCACGWLVGHAGGFALERVAPRGARCAVKIVGGVVLTAEWGAYYFVPLCRRLAPRALAPAVGAGAALAFYLFYARLLHETLYKGQGGCFDGGWQCGSGASPGVSEAFRVIAAQGS